jgi:hypothetical protein
MAEFTLLKLNFEDAELTANAPYSRSGGDDTEPDADTDPDVDTETSSGTGRVLAALVGLCFCVAVAYLVRTRVFGGEEEEEEEEEEEGADDVEALEPAA